MQLSREFCIDISSCFKKNKSSVSFRFARVGPVVLAVHDGSDVFLEIAKMSRYSGYQGIADIFFLLFVLSFTLLRIVCYPLLILRGTR